MSVISKDSHNMIISLVSSISCLLNWRTCIPPFGDSHQHLLQILRSLFSNTFKHSWCNCIALGECTLHGSSDNAFLVNMTSRIISR